MRLLPGQLRYRGRVLIRGSVTDYGTGHKDLFGTMVRTASTTKMANRKPVLSWPLPIMCATLVPSRVAYVDANLPNPTIGQTFRSMNRWLCKTILFS